MISFKVLTKRETDLHTPWSAGFGYSQIAGVVIFVFQWRKTCTYTSAITDNSSHLLDIYPIDGLL